MQVQTQRELMRHLFKKDRVDAALIVAAYAKAESAGFVLRTSNVCGLSATAYKKRLLNDGFQNGWLSDS